jgi:glycosyltransferase involved in cell wall biosynthesis
MRESDVRGPAVVEPRVSVVTPFLNGQEFLEEAVESVRAQTLRDWELLLVDDGSTDGGSAMAQRYARRFPARIRYFDHPGHRNRGKSVSRNLGVANARGEFIVFLDSDDVMLPHKLAHQVDIMGRQPRAAMVYGTTEYWHSWDAGSRRRDRVGKLGVAHDRLYAPPALMSAWLRKPGTVPCLCAVLVRTEAVRRLGGFDDGIQDLYEDQVVLAKLALTAEAYVDGHCGERYRQHAGSSSARAIAAGEYHPLRPNRARHAFLQWLQDYVDSCEVSDAALARALHAALRPYRHPRLYRALYPFVALAARLK